MKKIIFGAAVLASAFFAASCQQEMLDPQAEGTTVTYSVEVPNAIATKAIGDEITAVDKVYYEVYRAAEVDDLSKTPVYQGSETVDSNGQASFSLEFVKGQEFVVLFWAQNSALVNTDVTSDAGMYNIDDLRAVKLVNPGASNNEAAQVFAGSDTVTDCVSAANGNVTLTRPVSQINVYTTAESLDLRGVIIGLETSSMTVAGLYNTYNVAAGDAVEADENEATFAYTAAAVPAVAADNADFTYVAMNYVGFAPTVEGTNVTVDLTIKTTEAKEIKHKISNVPVKPNFRTNITGNLITATTDYNVSLNDDWGTPSFEVEVVNSVAELASIFEELNDVNSTVTKAEVALGADMDLSELFNLGASTFATKAGETAPLPIVIPEGKTVVLNLNGYNVTVPEQSAGRHYYAFDNYGTLTIQSSTGKGAILSRGIVNSGALTLESGTISSIDQNGGFAVQCMTGSTFVMNGGTLTTGEDDNFGAVTEGGYDATTLGIEDDATATINGGLIDNPSDFTFAIYNVGTVVINGGEIRSVHSTVSSYGNLTVNGGSFTCNGIEGITAHALVAWEDSETTINGGSFNGKDNYNGFNVDADKGAVVNITGGEFLPVHSGSLYGEGTINVTGGTFFDNPTDRLGEGYIAVKEGENWVVKQADAAIGETLYANFGDAVKAAQNGETIKLIANKVMIDADETISIATGKVLNIDLNGKTIYGETDQTGNREMFLVNGTLNVSNGTIEQKHVGANMKWSAMTTIFDVTAGGVVNLTSVTVKNLGGSDMGFVAHLNNWGEVTLTADNCIFESNYVALRVFNSGYDKNNVTIKNSTLKGGSYALWVHNYSDADFVNDKSTTAEKQKNLLNFNITENNTFIGKNETTFRYGMTDAIYAGPNDVIVWAATELESVVKAGKKMILAKDIEMSKSIAISNAAFELNGNGKTITMAEDATNTYALFDITGGKAAFKNVTFDGVKSGAVVRTVGVEFDAENVTAKNGQHTQQQGLFRLLGKSTIKNCTFKNNSCNMVVTLNYDTAENGSHNTPQVVENCVFEGNTCNGTAALYYVKGESAIINGNKFIGNTVNCSANGATVYMGFTENNVVTNNLFQDNTVNEAGESARVAGGIFFGYETEFTGNAFIGNKVTGTNAKGNDVCVSTYYTNIDISGNYWAGKAPIEDTNYFIQHKSDERKVIINDYLTVNPFN